jgi:hypothetical protein
MPKIDNLLVEKFMRIAKIDHLKESFEKKSLKEANFEDKGPDLPKTFNYEGLKKYFDEFDDKELARDLYLLHQDKKLSSIIDLLKKEVLANTRSSNSERRKAEKLIQAIRDMESSKRVSSKETFVLDKTDPFYDTFNYILRILQGDAWPTYMNAIHKDDKFKYTLANDFKEYLGDPSFEKDLENEMDVENAVKKMVDSFIKMASRNEKRLALLFQKQRYPELKKDIYQIITTAIATVSGPEKGDKRAPALESRKKKSLKEATENLTNEYFFDKNGSLFITCDRQDPQALEFGPRGCAKRVEIVTLVDRYPPEGVSDLEFIKNMLDIESDIEFNMYFETENGFIKMRERTVRDIGIIANEWHEGEMYESRFTNSARLVGESKKKKRKAKGPVNKPRRIRKGEPGYGKKKFVVLAKQGSKTKTIKYGDANLEIKRDNPKRRKSFNARHKCKTAKDKLSARYWSCRQ